MGHNFGMEHDAGYPEPCKCSGYSCIMSPSSSNLNSTTYFSDCSLEYLEHALKECEDVTVEALCLAPISAVLPVNANLPKMHLLQMEIVATMTHASRKEQQSCPADFFVQNGLTCPDDLDSFCYEGMCGSRDQQCKLFGDQLARTQHLNYGTLSGNCGYDRESERYIPCKQSNVDCGRLQCQHLSEKPVFGDPSTIHSAYNFVRLSTGQEAACRVIRTTYTGGKRKPDPGMVPDGAKCGKDKLCLGAECKNHSEVVQMVSKCEPVHCNQKGICNNVGNCHCQNGYGGVGSNDQVFNPGVVLLYLFVIGLILFCIATFYCKRKETVLAAQKDLEVCEAVTKNTVCTQFQCSLGDSSAEVNQVIVRPTLSSTMVPAKVTLVEQAFPKPNKNVLPPIHQNIINKHPATVNTNKHHHQRKVSSSKGVPHNNSSKQEHRALKAESSSDEHPFESDFSIRNVAAGQVLQASTEYIQSTPPPPPPHKHTFGERKEAPAPPKKKSKEASPPGLMTREVTSPKPAVKDKPKLPNKPPVAAKKLMDEKSSAKTQNDSDGTVNVKALAARFNTNT
uniref:Peptidase M12B domain-containing protein n=1 Tax=Ditylenchus dipsaci TaxID=166011 RepID=A0A915CYC0_9BILA